MPGLRWTVPASLSVHADSSFREKSRGSRLRDPSCRTLDAPPTRAGNLQVLLWVTRHLIATRPQTEANSDLSSPAAAAMQWEDHLSRTIQSSQDTRATVHSAQSSPSPSAPFGTKAPQSSASSVSPDFTDSNLPPRPGGSSRHQSRCLSCLSPALQAKLSSIQSFRANDCPSVPHTAKSRIPFV